MAKDVPSYRNLITMKNKNIDLQKCTARDTSQKAINLLCLLPLQIYNINNQTIPQMLIENVKIINTN
jgi:hypothetical protein